MTRRAALLGFISFAAIGIGMALAVAGVISRLQFDLVFALACGYTVIVFMIKIGVGRVRAVLVTTVLTAGAIMAQLAYPDMMLTPYLAVVLINGLVAYVFARGLMPGREPLITQIARLADSGCDASRDFQRFAYGQCRIWMALGLLTSLCGLAAMMSPPDRVTAGMTISGLIMVQVAWFVLSHLYANRRYGRPETWLDTLRIMSRPTFWTELKI